MSGMWWCEEGNQSRAKSGQGVKGGRVAWWFRKARDLLPQSYRELIQSLSSIKA